MIEIRSIRSFVFLFLVKLPRGSSERDEMALCDTQCISFSKMSVKIHG